MHQWLLMTDGKAEHEFGTLSWLRFEPYDAIKLRHNQLTNNKSEANTIGARLLFDCIVLAKQSEQFGLVFFLDAYSGVPHIHLDEAVFLIDCLYLNVPISVRELDCILHNVQQNLRKSLLVSIDIFCIFEAVNIDTESDVFEFDLILKKSIDLLHA